MRYNYKYKWAISVIHTFFVTRPPACVCVVCSFVCRMES